MMTEKRRGIDVFIILWATNLVFALIILTEAYGAGLVQQTPNVTAGRGNPQLPAVSSGTGQATTSPVDVTKAQMNSIPSMFDRIGKLEEDMAALQQKLSDQEQKLVAAQQKLSDQEQKLTTVQQKLSDQEQKLVAQQQAFSQFKDAYAKHVHDFTITENGGMQISLLGFKQILDDNPGGPYLIKLIDAAHPIGTITQSTGPVK
jgi:TolA-binding protein